MDAIFAWASSLPVWAQVVVGLTVFFVVIPAVLFALFWVLSFLRSIIETIPLAFKLVLGIACVGALLTVPFALWAGAMHVVDLAAHHLGLSLPGWLSAVAAVLLLAALLAPALYGTYRWQAPLRSRLRASRARGDAR